MKQSLGLIEVSGLALAITVSDVMAKVASIQLLGIEKTKGSGWMVVKIAGDVASVEAAIATGADFAKHRNGLVASKVIARPINDLDVMLIQKESPKAKQVAPAVKAVAQPKKPAQKAAVKSASPVKKVEVVKKANIVKKAEAVKKTDAAKAVAPKAKAVQSKPVAKVSTPKTGKTVAKPAPVAKTAVAAPKTVKPAASAPTIPATTSAVTTVASGSKKLTS